MVDFSVLAVDLLAIGDHKVDCHLRGQERPIRAARVNRGGCYTKTKSRLFGFFHKVGSGVRFGYCIEYEVKTVRRADNSMLK